MPSVRRRRDRDREGSFALGFVRAACLAVGFSLLGGFVVLQAAPIDPRSPLASVLGFALVLPALLTAIGFHEWAHAYTAVRLGDPTADYEGRLSLNPLDHLDPLGSVIIILAFATGAPLIGWGKPVPVQGGNFRNPIKDMTRVAAAGPMMNLLMGGIGAVLLASWWHWSLGVRMGMPEHATGNVVRLLSSIVYLNFALAMFNLLPIPPLDGNWVLRYWLRSDHVAILASMEPYGIFILYVLMFSGVLALPYMVMSSFIQGILWTPWRSFGYLLVIGMVWFFFLRSMPRYWLRRT